MAGIRAWLAAVGTCCLLLPAAASASRPANDVLSPPPAPVVASGDRVPFVIPDSKRGDRYAVLVDGKAVAEGVDDTAKPGFVGEFTLPDLGSAARELAMLIEVTRASDGSTHSYGSPLHYRAEVPGSVGLPANTPRSVSQLPRVPLPKLLPVKLPVSVGPFPKRAGRLWSKLGGRTLRGPERVLHGPSEVVPLRSRGSLPSHHKPRARHHRRPLNHVRPAPDPTPPKASSVPPPRDTREKLSGTHFPGLGYTVAWQLLAAVIAASLLVPSLFGGLAQLRRRREAHMEAELQEIVAEERARRRLRV